MQLTSEDKKLIKAAFDLFVRQHGIDASPRCLNILAKLYEDEPVFPEKGEGDGNAS